MNKLILKTSLAALMAGSLGTAIAENISGTATANVIAPLTVAETVALDFGDIAGGATAGTIVISSAGAISATGGATFVPASVSNQATFDITGAVSTAILVTVDFTGTQLDDGAGGGAVMPISAFTTTALPVTTDAGGLATFDVGATLDVGINQTAGAYDTVLGAGVPYSVTVNYN